MVIDSGIFSSLSCQCASVWYPKRTTNFLLKMQKITAQSISSKLFIVQKLNYSLVLEVLSKVFKENEQLAVQNLQALYVRLNTTTCNVEAKTLHNDDSVELYDSLTAYKTHRLLLLHKNQKLFWVLDYRNFGRSLICLANKQLEILTNRLHSLICAADHSDCSTQLPRLGTGLLGEEL